jgi:hypothetical protein
MALVMRAGKRDHAGPSPHRRSRSRSEANTEYTTRLTQYGYRVSCRAWGFLIAKRSPGHRNGGDRHPKYNSRVSKHVSWISRGRWSSFHRVDPHPQGGGSGPGSLSPDSSPTSADYFPLQHGHAAPDIQCRHTTRRTRNTQLSNSFPSSENMFEANQHC